MHRKVEEGEEAQDDVHVAGHARGGDGEAEDDEGQDVGGEAQAPVQPVEDGPVLVVGRGPQQPTRALQQSQPRRHAAQDAVQAGGRGPALEVDEGGDDGDDVQHHRQHHQQSVPLRGHARNNVTQSSL